LAQDTPRITEARFFELDILRGVAASMVVLFHYKHFLLDDTGNFDYARMPLYALLAPVYVYGQFFVELFFSISGYVFFWLYAEAVSERRVGLRSFFIARFSRLYPLFFLTFVAVALIQWAFVALYGQAYIYQENSPGQFVLNLFMVHQWLPGAQMSFNGPSWSISVEVFLYAVFFALCAFRLNKPVMIAAVVVLGLLFKYLQPQPAPDFTRGIPNFFLGGLIFYAVEYLRHHARAVWLERVEKVLVWVVPMLWLIAFVIGHDLIWGPVSDWIESHDIGSSTILFSTDSFVYVLVPLTLLALGLQQGKWLNLEGLQKWAWVGDVSYSVYLIHFPLQLIVMIGLAHLPFETRAGIFASPLVLGLFMAVALGLARLSFLYFEMPMRRLLKDWLTRRLAPGTPIL
jgi:peptidoglycan/LPS O-acetylase OafA/YrhL